MNENKTKSGFVILIGRSNVGKSTLLNTIIGTKIAATSFRPQMTRHIIHGVLNTQEGQAVFIDTPGVFKAKKSLLSAKLINKVKEAVTDIDLIIYVVDPTREIGEEERATFGMIRYTKTPKILVINKSDLPEKERSYQEDYQKWSEEFDAVFSLSALRGSHVQPLKEKVMELIPEGEKMYPDWQLTNMNKEFWIAEIIREKIFSVFEKEVPYSITVEVLDVEEKEDVTVVKANILTDQVRYKKMIRGFKGRKMARRELEQAIGTKVYLDLEVEVDKHWIERL
jgi:GTP-binding protein Era